MCLILRSFVFTRIRDRDTLHVSSQRGGLFLSTFQGGSFILSPAFMQGSEFQCPAFIQGHVFLTRMDMKALLGFVPWQCSFLELLLYFRDLALSFNLHCIYNFKIVLYPALVFVVEELGSCLGPVLLLI